MGFVASRTAKAASYRRGAAIFAENLPGLEEWALGEFMDERAEAAGVFLGVGDDGSDWVAVSEGDVAAGGVDGQLLRKVLQQQS